MRKTFLSLLIPALLSAGCWSTGSQRSRTPSDLLLPADIEETAYGSAYELVRRERPSWLRTRGVNSINNNLPLMVYVDGIRMGGPESLESISTMSVERMEYLSAAEAQSRFGLNNTQGAILVTTRRR